MGTPFGIIERTAFKALARLMTNLDASNRLRCAVESVPTIATVTTVTTVTTCATVTNIANWGTGVNAQSYSQQQANLGYCSGYRRNLVVT